MTAPSNAAPAAAASVPPQPSRTLLPPETESPHVRSGTLVNLRWLAILGQASTVVLAKLAFAPQIELGLCALAIGASVVANLVTIALQPATARLPERWAFGSLLYDLVQLTALLFLTGGLHNPFALLFLAPVTISATALSLRSTLTLAGAAIALTSLLGFHHLPLVLRDGSILSLPPLQLAGFWVAISVGTLFLSSFAWRLVRETERMSNALLATQTALAREQKLHDLGGVVAAAAHELGTPLATITLVAAELAEELEDRPAQRDDARLIREQADRCRDILRSMGRAGKGDRQVRSAPLETILREAAEPHAARGIDIRYDLSTSDGSDPGRPLLRRSPEVIHGLRNLVQNAVDFASERVWIDARLSGSEVWVRIIDDGPGYPAEVLSRLGDPFLRSRRRANYEGMGLGLFIAKTLLERTGAAISFANGSRPGRRRPQTRAGAIAEVVWPRAAIMAGGAGGLGANTRLDG